MQQFNHPNIIRIYKTPTHQDRPTLQMTLLEKSSAAATVAVPQHQAAKRLSVLVVEDNAVNRMLIGSYLDEFGLTHEVAASGGFWQEEPPATVGGRDGGPRCQTRSPEP